MYNYIIKFNSSVFNDLSDDTLVDMVVNAVDIMVTDKRLLLTVSVETNALVVGIDDKEWLMMDLTLLVSTIDYTKKVKNNSFIVC